MKVSTRSLLWRANWAFALLCLVILLPGHVIAQASFEGAVTYKMDAQGKGPDSFTYYMKGNKARMEMEMPAQAQMGKAAFIIDGDQNALITLIPQMKMYMQMSMPPVDSTDYNGDDSDGPEQKPVKLSDTKVILGHTCDHWRIHNEDGETVDLWNAKGFGNFMMPGRFGGMPGQGKRQEWLKDLMGKGFFPLKVVVTKQGGSTEMSMEATKIEKKNLDDSLFEVPSGYNKMNLPNMSRMGQQN